MTPPLDALREIWSLGGGEPSALTRVSLAGADPFLPSSFRVGTAAQVSIAAAGLAAAELWRLRTGRAQRVHVDLRAAVIEFRSERYLRIAGRESPPMWDALAGVYRTGDGRFVRLHTNFAHHRRRVVELLGASDSRESVQQALLGWKGEDFETAANGAGAVVALMRSAEEWSAHPQARALAALPVLEIARIGDAPPRPLPPADRPLAGVRVLDLTRIVAGPVCGRTLAAHGADVLRVASPQLPSIEWLVIDTGRGKRSAWVDLETADGRDALRRLLRDADLFVQGYRPGGLAARGFGPEDAARVRPGIVYVSLSAYSHLGPWAGRRGFDSLVQTATGFNHAEGALAGMDGPKELPAQALDHGSGQLMAAAAMLARARQAREGGSWHVRVSLAQTGRWLAGLGRVENGLAARDSGLADVQDRLEESESAFGTLRAVRHAAELSETPAHFALPARPLGSSPPTWSDAER
ncbi:MAG TPA: CoA transferase [Myxococcota bacterium]|nr:CoA transferase [Myxococcota bacterium]